METIEKQPEKIVFEWWQDLDDARNKRPRFSHLRPNPFNTSDSALLRRSKTLEEIILNCPAYHNLRSRLKTTPWQNDKTLALIAGLLAHVKDKSPKEFPELMAMAGIQKKSLEGLKSRFQRLLQISESEELLHVMRRLIQQADSGIHISSLAKSLYWWSDKERQRWAIKFYETVLHTNKGVAQ
jgi:CRISPR type I-E-associated protein CasB/Cse2